MTERSGGPNEGGAPAASGLGRGTVLVTIDLMDRIVTLDLAPHRGEVVVERCKRLASRFRAAGMPVIHVRSERPGPTQPPGSDFVVGLVESGDISLVKRSIGAFATTPMHDVLRQRRIERIVLTGIATNLSVESTARVASDLDLDVVPIEDAMTALSEPEHTAAVTLSLPRFGKLRTYANLPREFINPPHALGAADDT